MRTRKPSLIRVDDGKPLTKKDLNNLIETPYIMDTGTRLQMRIQVSHLFSVLDVMKMTYKQMYDFMMYRMFEKKIANAIIKEGWGMQECVPYIVNKPQGRMLRFVVNVEFTWSELM